MLNKIPSRFNDKRFYRYGEHSKDSVEIKLMDTAHIMNTIKMYIYKPIMILTSLVQDIERSKENNIYKKINAVTSMTYDELIVYVLKSPMVESMIAQLERRGVNTEVFLENMINELQ